MSSTLLLKTEILSFLIFFTLAFQEPKCMHNPRSVFDSVSDSDMNCALQFSEALISDKSLAWSHNRTLGTFKVITDTRTKHV